MGTGMKKSVIVFAVIIAAGLILFAVNGGFDKSPAAYGTETFAGLIIASAGVCILLSILLSSLLRKMVKAANATNFLACQPIILFPYVYLVVLFIIAKVFLDAIDIPDLRNISADIVMDWINTIEGRIRSASDSSFWIIWLSAMIYPSLLIGSMICAFRLRPAELAPEKAAGMNIAIKALHIPSHIIHFNIGIIGLAASLVWSGILLFALFMGAITLAVSGTYALAVVTGMYRSHRIKGGTAALLAVLSYLPLADIIVSIVICVMANSRSDMQTAIPAQAAQYTPRPAQYTPQPAQQYTAAPAAQQGAAPIIGYDPQTGVPIYAQPVGYDPQTGAPIYAQPVGYDPQTGAPIFPPAVPQTSGTEIDPDGF